MIIICGSETIRKEYSTAYWGNRLFGMRPVAHTPTMTAYETRQEEVVTSNLSSERYSVVLISYLNLHARPVVTFAVDEPSIGVTL